MTVTRVLIDAINADSTNARAACTVINIWNSEIEFERYEKVLKRRVTSRRIRANCCLVCLEPHTLPPMNSLLSRRSLGSSHIPSHLGKDCVTSPAWSSFRLLIFPPKDPLSTAWDNSEKSESQIVANLTDLPQTRFTWPIQQANECSVLTEWCTMLKGKVVGSYS